MGTRGGASHEGALLVHPGFSGTKGVPTGPRPYQRASSGYPARQASHSGPFPPFCEGPARCAHPTQQEGEQQMTIAIQIIAALIAIGAAAYTWHLNHRN